MSEKENRLPDYIDYPFDRFIKLRVELLILSQNELEAKIMRIIEWCVETERNRIYIATSGSVPKGQKVVLPDEIWVAIPKRFFLEWLYGTVQSENTFNDALNSVIGKHLVFRRESSKGGRYDAMEYTLNKPLIMKLFELFPRSIDEIDMTSVMKQPRKQKQNDNQEGQKLTPSLIDPLIKRIRDAKIDPLNSQLLTPSASIIDPLAVLGGGQLLTPNKDSKETLKETNKDIDTESDVANANHSTLSPDSLQEMIALLAENGYIISPPSKNVAGTNGTENNVKGNSASDNDSQSQQSHNARPLSITPLQSGGFSTDQRTNSTPLSLGGGLVTPPTESVANPPGNVGDVGATNGQHTLLSDSHTNPHSDGSYRGDNDSDTLAHGVGFQQVHQVATQDSAILPSQPSDNPSTSLKPSNGTQSSGFASQCDSEASVPGNNSKRATSYSQDIQEPPLAAESNSPSRQKPRTRKPAAEKPAPPEPTPEEIAAAKAMDERCKAWQKRINKWRGYELETKGAVINERRCIRKLCEKYTDQQNKQIYVYLFETDWRWSKPDNRFKIGASEMLAEAGRVLQQLSGKPAIVVDEDLPDNVTPITSAQSSEPTNDLRVIAARARERAMAQGGN